MLFKCKNRYLILKIGIGIGKVKIFKESVQGESVYPYFFLIAHQVVFPKIVFILL